MRIKKYLTKSLDNKINRLIIKIYLKTNLIIIRFRLNMRLILPCHICPTPICTKLLFCAMLYIPFYTTFDPYPSASPMLFYGF